MVFALGYIAAASAAVWLLTVLLRRSQTPRYGVACIRAGLLWSSALMACHAAMFLVLGFWVTPPLATIMIGFMIPVIMPTIT